MAKPIIVDEVQVLRFFESGSIEKAEVMFIQTFIRRVADVAGLGVIGSRTRVDAVTADPDDNRILECAVDGKADLIVSNDRHLLDLKEYTRIPIVASVDFRRTLGLK
jgi:predicted nucleic acid-binding protein